MIKQEQSAEKSPNMKNPENSTFSGLFLAHPARFERATFRLGGGRSILLSYGCITNQE